MNEKKMTIQKNIKPKKLNKLNVNKTKNTKNQEISFSKERFHYNPTNKNTLHILHEYLKLQDDKHILIKLVKNVQESTFSDIKSIYKISMENKIIKFIKEVLKAYNEEILKSECLSLNIFLIENGFIEGMTVELIFLLKDILIIYENKKILNEFVSKLELNLRNKFIYKTRKVELYSNNFRNVKAYIKEIIKIIPTNLITNKLVELMMTNKMYGNINLIVGERNDINFLNILIKKLNKQNLFLLEKFKKRDVFVILFKEIFTDKNIKELLKKEKKEKGIYLKIFLLLIFDLKKEENLISFAFHDTILVFFRFVKYFFKLFSESSGEIKKNFQNFDKKSLKKYLKFIEIFYLIGSDDSEEDIKISKRDKKISEEDFKISKAKIREILIEENIFKEKSLIAETKDLVTEKYFYMKTFASLNLFIKIFFSDRKSINIFVKKSVREMEKEANKENIFYAFLIIKLIENNLKEFDYKSLYILISLDFSNNLFSIIIESLLKKINLRYFSKIHSNISIEIVIRGFFQRMRFIFIKNFSKKEIEDFFLRICDLNNFDDSINNLCKKILKEEINYNLECINGKEFSEYSFYKKYGQIVDFKRVGKSTDLNMKGSKLCFNSFE